MTDPAGTDGMPLDEKGRDAEALTGFPEGIFVYNRFDNFLFFLTQPLVGRREGEQQENSS